jgi:hypothetical protein
MIDPSLLVVPKEQAYCSKVASRGCTWWKSLWHHVGTLLEWITTVCFWQNSTGFVMLGKELERDWCGNLGPVVLRSGLAQDSHYQNSPACFQS